MLRKSTLLGKGLDSTATEGVCSAIRTEGHRVLVDTRDPAWP